MRKNNNGEKIKTDQVQTKWKWFSEQNRTVGKKIKWIIEHLQCAKNLSKSFSLFSSCDSQQLQEIGTMITSIFKMRKLKSTEVRRFAWNYKSNEWWRRFESRSFGSKPVLLIIEEIVKDNFHEVKTVVSLKTKGCKEYYE